MEDGTHRDGRPVCLLKRRSCRGTPVLSSPLILTVRALQAFGEDRCSHMAAAISYYALLSLFPLLILLVSVVGIFLRSSSLQQDLVEQVLDILPLTQDEGP